MFKWLLLLGYIQIVYSDLINYSLTLERKLLNLDGYERDGIAVNGDYIGPTIEATVGDQLLITVTNHLLPQEVLSMHWHGIQQLYTPWADGTAYITNCPINHGSSYTYNFTATEAGTFWYHAHIGNLGMEGSNGMIVIYDQETQHFPSQTRSLFGSYDYDEELRIILSDWFHPSVYRLNAMLEHNPLQWSGNGDTILINGKGECKECSYNGSTTTITTTYHDGTQTSTSTYCKGKREIFKLEPGKTYLVRLLNAASLAFYNIAIASHYFTILGIDGMSFTEPVDVNSIDLSSGQRYMALLRYNAPKQSAYHYETTINNSILEKNLTYIMQVQTDWRGDDRTNAGIAYAYVTYDETSNVTDTSLTDISPISPLNESRDWKDWYTLLEAIELPLLSWIPLCPDSTQVTKTFTLDVKQQMINLSTGKGLNPPAASTVTSGSSSLNEDDVQLGWTVYNDSRLLMPTTPYLLSRYMEATYKNYSKFLAIESSSSSSSNSNGIPAVVLKGQSVRDSSETSTLSNTQTQRSGRDSSGSMNTLTSSTTSSTTTSPLQPLRIERGDVVDVIIQSYASISGVCDLHPWHLHGHSFWLISRGQGLYSTEADSPPTQAYSHQNQPLRMDTISGYPSNYSRSWAEVSTGTVQEGKWEDPCGWFKVRFIADNPGYWMFHCHVGWHLEMGMGVVFDESSEQVGAPPGDYNMCGIDGTYEVFQALASTNQSTIIITTTNNNDNDDINSITVEEKNDFVHSPVFASLLTFVLLFFIILVGSGIYWGLKRYGHCKIVFFQLEDEVENPMASMLPKGVHNRDIEGGGSGWETAADIQLNTLSRSRHRSRDKSLSRSTSFNNRSAYNSDDDLPGLSCIRPSSPARERSNSPNFTGNIPTFSSAAIRAAEQQVGYTGRGTWGGYRSASDLPVERNRNRSSSQPQNGNTTTDDEYEINLNNHHNLQYNSVSEEEHEQSDRRRIHKAGLGWRTLKKSVGKAFH